MKVDGKQQVGHGNEGYQSEFGGPNAAPAAKCRLGRSARQSMDAWMHECMDAWMDGWTDDTCIPSGNQTPINGDFNGNIV
jgi:hypothetical protein